MATTTGLVQKIVWSQVGPSACIFVGPSPNVTELFLIEFRSSDSNTTIAYKKGMLNLLTKAQAAGYQVALGHPQQGAEIDNVMLKGFNICPIGMAVHNDFYSISGTGIPADAEIVFESDSITVTVTPDLVRPHWVCVIELPSAIPVGRNTVRLQAPGWSSDGVPVDVRANPPATIRVLYSGAPKSRPYTIAFVANPAIEAEVGWTFSADPILTNRSGYHDVVGYCLRNLLTETEDLLRQDDIDAHIRFVSIFDPTLGVSADNSLAHEIAPNLMETRRNRLRAFLAQYNEVADMVFVIHDSTTHDRATAWFTTDDSTMPDTAYTYDGTNRVHGHFPSIPGSAALPVTMNQTGLTPLHEFGHGASDFDNGRVIDLYVNGGIQGFVVNKKARANSADPIPVNFASCQATNYQSDQNRDGIGYPNNWRSYHPELIDATRPNMMDNYWWSFDTPLRCRLDHLTYNWLSDRLGAKIFR